MRHALALFQIREAKEFFPSAPDVGGRAARLGPVATQSTPRTLRTPHRRGERAKKCPEVARTTETMEDWPSGLLPP